MEKLSSTDRKEKATKRGQREEGNQTQVKPIRAEPTSLDRNTGMTPAFTIKAGRRNYKDKHLN